MSPGLVSRFERLRSGNTSLAPLDLILSGVASSVAVYAGSASLSSDKDGQFFLWIVLLGTLASIAFVAILGRSKAILADATAYTAVALGSFFGIASLNALLPDPIYSGPLAMAGILSWMLALGSFTIWRDQTMLFQAVPAVALFGLVGCYDTFRESVIYFFVFLVCQATLLARAHGRAMLRQAQSTTSSQLDMTDMRKGPWKWMAGPEWALGSALAIVTLSAIGAPILRESAQSFSGLVRYTPPISPLSAPALSSISRMGTAVGQGPNRVSDIPVLRVTLSEPTYLRSFAYGAYSEGSWYPRAVDSSTGGGIPEARRYARTAMTDTREITFRIEPLLIYNYIVPVPGEVTDLAPQSQGYFWRDYGDSFSIRSDIRADPPYPVLEGRSVVFGGKARIGNCDRAIANLVPEYLSKEGIPDDVAAFAKRVTANARTDWDKARAIKSAIENTAKYNLSAARTPAGVDPVSYFLFTSKEGYCDLFASSMTLMARSVGLPARYVTGYYPFNSDPDEDGRLVIRQKDAHAWCEIFFKNAGWVIFDATENAVEVGEGRGSSNEIPFWRSGWFLVVASFAGLGAGVFLAIKGYQILRRRWVTSAERRGLRTELKLRGALARQYRAYERELRAAAKRPRGVAETILEYTSVAAPNLGGRTALGWKTSSAFASTFYAAATPSATQIDELKRQVKAFRKAKS